MHVPFVNLSQQTALLLPELRGVVERVLLSGQYILGEEVEAFEREFAAYLGVDFAVGVNSGTDALSLAMRACQWTGFPVIVPAMTFVATAAAVIHAGARPVFADIDPATGMLSENTIRDAVDRWVRASEVWVRASEVGTFPSDVDADTVRILPVHLYGAPQSKLSFERWVRGRSGLIIEDAAEACGAVWPEGEKVGTRGICGCFSFVPTKNLGGYGDGGMVVTDVPEVAERVRLWRDHGRTGHASHVLPGYNSRLDAIHAAMLRVKLSHLDAWNVRRRQIVDFYRERLANCEITFPEVEGTGSYQVCVILLRNATIRADVRARLTARGITTLLHYERPVPSQLAYMGYVLPHQTFPVAQNWAERCLTLPNFPEMTDAEVEYVAEAVKQEVSE